MIIYIVTPYVGVWIETRMWTYFAMLPHVTPYVGVWIETRTRHRSHSAYIVTPYVGVWIETCIYPNTETS